MGVGPRQYEAYLREVERSVTRAALAVERKEAQIAAKMATAEWRAEVRKNVPAATEEWERRKDWRAFRYIKRGEILGEDGQPIPNPDLGKLDRAEVRTLLGERAAEVEPLFRGRIVKSGGEPVADVAERLGFDDPTEMFDAILAMPQRKEWIQARAQELTREAHPEIEAEMERLREVADVTLRNEGNSDWLLEELASLRRRSGGEGSPVDALRKAAEIKVAETEAHTLPVGHVRQRELAAANEAALAVARGEWRRARVLKERQILAHFEHRELVRARDMREDFHELAAKLTRERYRQRLGKASPAHRDVIDTLLEGLGIVDPRPAEEGRQGLEALLRAMEENGDTVVFDIDLVSSLLHRPRRWQDLKVSELREVLAALRNIKKSAANRNTAIVDGRRFDRETIAAALVAEAADHLPRLPAPASSEPAMNLLQRGLSLGAAWDGYNLKPQTMIEWLGGGGIDSMWYRAVIKPLQHGKHRQADLLRETVRPVVELFEHIPQSVRGRLMDRVDGFKLFPSHRDDLQPPTRRFELLMLGLHRGNESSIERLTLGRNITLDQVDAALGTLTREELDWIQAVWDAAESLWPMARELEERDSGTAPPKLERAPFEVTLADGTVVQMRGGYFPAVYDRRVSQVGEKQASQTAGAIMDPSYTRPGTSRSYLKRRADNFADALSLDPSAIQLHLVKVTHDLAYRESLRSVANLLMDPTVSGAMRRHLGEERARVFLQWLKDIGNQEAANVDAHAGLLARGLRKLRSNAAIGTLGYAIDNFIGDTSNILVSISGTDLEARHMAAALTEYAREPAKTRAFVLEHSGEVRARTEDHRRELDLQVRDITKRQNLPARAARAYRDHAFWIAEQIDAATVTPAWLGRYRQAEAEGRSHAEAVELANLVIQQSFPSRFALDMAPLQRDKGFLGQLSYMMGYLNVLYNLDRRQLHTAFRERGVDWKRRAWALGHYVAGIIASRVWAEFLVGRGPEASDGDDELERWAVWFLRKMLVGTISPMPMIGGMVESWALGKAPSIRLNPQFAVLDGIGKVAWRTWQGGGDGEAAAWAAARALGMLRGYPTRPMRWVERAMQGEGPGGVIYGERSGAPVNPLTPLDRALE